MFRFGEFSSISDVDSAIDGVSLLGGDCTAGSALSKCHANLFARSSRGRKRSLVTFIAGTSSDDVYIPAASLRMCGVRIMVVSMSSLVLHSQLTDIAYPPSYVLRTDAIEGVQNSSESVSVLISQG